MGCCGKNTVKKVRHIVEGNAKYMGYALGVIPKDKYEFWNGRMRECRKCEQNIWILKKLFCKICKCYCPAKAMVKEEECPLNKWKGIDNGK